jgi:hypothetical protein
MPAISNFKGLVSDADFGDVPEGAAQSQKNLSTTRPGALIPRQGIQPATFDSTQTISGSAYNTFQKMSFCKTRFGDLIGVNGVDRGFRWDGASDTADELGITAPSVGPVIEISAIQTDGSHDNEIATIVAKATTGEYQLATTYAHGLTTGDRIHLGQIQVTDDGAMPGQLNGRKFVVTVISSVSLYLDDTEHEGTYDTTNKGTWSRGSSGTTIAATDTVAVHQADDLLGQGATEGEYLCAYRYVDASSTPIYSMISPEMTEIPDTFATYRFSWTAIEQPTLANDPTRRVKKIELWRSTSGQKNILYPVAVGDDALDVTHDGTDLTYVNDLKDDETLNATVEGDQLFITDQGVLVARRQVLPPNDMAYVVMFQDRYFYFGIVKYNAGTVTVTEDSPTITGASTSWTTEMIDRYIEVDGEANANLLITNVVGQTITIDQPIERASAGTLSYVITPEKSRRRQILFSYKDEPESVPETNSLTLQENANDDDEIVGAMPYGPYLYVLSQRHKYSVSYTTNPATDGSVRFLDDRGAFNHSCWDIFENTAYLMDDAGCYSFDGKESKTISGAIQDIWRRDSTGHQIDFSKQANFFVKADRPKEKVYFFVSFVGDTDLLPTRALVFNIRRQTFDPMHYPMQIAGASMIEKDGETRLVFGAENEKVHLVDEGTTDLITAEVVATAVGGGSQTDSNLMAPSSTFVSGHVGTSVYIFEGTGKGQRRTIHTFAGGTEIGVRVDWDTRPDATSKFVVGAVEWNWKSSSFPIVASDDRTPRSVELKFKPTATAQSADVRMFYNGSTTVMTNETAVNEGDAVEIRETNKSDVVFHMKSDRSILSDSTGRETYRFSSANSISGQGDHSLAIELRGYVGDEAQEIQEISIDGVGSVGQGEE